ncbi:TPA: DNA-binding response regulator [Vibrio vulnificus]|nr:DNA-binding response regulator [Vibrio vulnificus]
MTANDATRLATLHQNFSNEKLSNNQKDIALMYALGFTFDEIADEKGIKPITVRNHLDTARKSMGNLTLNGLRSVILLRVLAGKIS